MLTDHRIEQERWAHENRRRRKLPRAFGKLIAVLAAWDWFINPLTFRDQPRFPGPPEPFLAMHRINEFLLSLQRASENQIGWVIAEEFGRLGGRYHCHALITGVRSLSRKYWQKQACLSFGYTRIQDFIAQGGASFYVSKYEGRLDGNIELGGFLKGRDLSRCLESRSVGGGRDVVRSEPLPRSHFHMCLPRRHR
jgi:hypothetical protein